nr:hypothetical protein [uncultured Oscillibacter sp.]
MKNLPVGKVPYGTTFKVFDDEFIALDYQDGAVLAIRKEIWRKAPFDEGGKNDLRTASINKHLAEYEDTLIKAGAQGSLRARNFDLKATDGTREYGYLAGVCVALLTLEQYGKYQHLIPDVDGWWWLATPVWTPAQKGGDASCAWYVYTSGGYTTTAAALTPMASAPLCTFPLPSWSPSRTMKTQRPPLTKAPFSRNTWTTSTHGPRKRNRAPPR